MSTEERKVMLLREEDAKKKLDEMALNSMAKALDFNKAVKERARFLKQCDMARLIFGVTPKTLRNNFLTEAVNRGEVTTYKMGASIFYDTEEVIEVFKRKNQAFI